MKDNTLLWIAGGGLFLWWYLKNQPPAPQNTPVASVPGALPQNTSVTPTNTGVAQVPQNGSLITSANVTPQNVAPLVSQSGAILPSQVFSSGPVASQNAAGSSAGYVNPPVDASGNPIVILPQMNNAKYQQFENGDYPGGNVRQIPQ